MSILGKIFTWWDGATVGTYACHPEDKSQCEQSRNQKWTLEASGTIVSKMHSKCLDVASYSGPRVEVWSCNGQTNQKWEQAADGTLICSFGPLGRGSALTEALAIRHDRPVLHIDFDHTPVARAAVEVERWLHAHRIATLNVAGPRASSEPRIHAAVFALLTAIDWAALAPGPSTRLLEEQT